MVEICRYLLKGCIGYIIDYIIDYITDIVKDIFKIKAWHAILELILQLHQELLNFLIMAQK